MLGRKVIMKTSSKLPGAAVAVVLRLEWPFILSSDKRALYSYLQSCFSFLIYNCPNSFAATGNRTHVRRFPRTRGTFWRTLYELSYTAAAPICNHLCDKVASPLNLAYIIQANVILLDSISPQVREVDGNQSDQFVLAFSSYTCWAGFVKFNKVNKWMDISSASEPQPCARSILSTSSSKSFSKHNVSRLPEEQWSSG